MSTKICCCGEMFNGISYLPRLINIRTLNDKCILAQTKRTVTSLRLGTYIYTENKSKNKYSTNDQLTCDFDLYKQHVDQKKCIFRQSGEDIYCSTTHYLDI